MHPLPRAFYDRDPVEVSRELLGKLFIRRGRGGICVGKIVETEAYLARDDSASHSFRGMNRKNATMFGPPGHLYVYSIHARYCLNAVTEARQVASAVLIRAVEPLIGLQLMKERRGGCDLLDLTRGPARLCEAFGVDRSLDGWDLTRGTRVWIGDAESPDRERIATSQRVGVTSAHDLQLRFFVSDSPYVSRKRFGQTVPRIGHAAITATDRSDNDLNRSRAGT